MESNQSNSAALRAFRILEAVAEHPDGCTLPDIVESTVLPKQTVHRLVQQLVMAGVLLREPAGRRRLQLAYRAERLALGALMNGAGRHERHAILRSVVDSTGATCNLTALAGTDIIYLDRVQTSWPRQELLEPGSHVPLHATSSGKLLVSLLPRVQRERLLQHLRLRGFTEHTIVDSVELEQELEETRRRRVGINRCEHLRGLWGIAVPVMVDRQRACAAVALQTTAGQHIDELMVHVPRLRLAAQAIGRTLGVAQVGDEAQG